MHYIILLVILAMAGVAAAMLLNSPELAALAIFATAFVEWIFGTGSIQLGIHIYPGDFVFGLLALLGFIRLFAVRLRGLSKPLLAVYALFAILMISFFRGVMSYGVQPAGVDFRGDFYLLSAILYFSTFSYPERRIQRIFSLAAGMGAALICVIYVRLTEVLLGMDASSWNIAGQDYRPVNAQAALFLMVLFLFVMYRNFEHQSSLLRRLMEGFLLLTVVILRHRTLWVAIPATLLLMWLLDRSNSRKYLVRMLTAGGFITVVITAILISGSSLASGFRSAATNDQTLLWRIQGWGDLIHSMKGDTISYVFGAPYGSSMLRFLNGTWVTAGTHSFYVEALLRGGGVGLLMLLGLFISLGLSLRRLTVADIVGLHPAPSFWMALLILNILFSITYSPSYEQGIFLGMAISLALRDVETGEVGLDLTGEDMEEIGVERSVAM